MISLKKLHPYLYARVRLKAFVNILLGIAIIFPEYLPKGLTTHTANSSQLNYILPLRVWGIIFVAIGILILWGLRKRNNEYLLARRFLEVSLLYSFFWFVVLVATTILGYPRTASVMILWGYWVYNQFLIIRDPGWKALAVIKDARDGIFDSRR